MSGTFDGWLSTPVASLRKVSALVLVLALPNFALAHGDEVHGDHDARHGGFVMMYVDLHFEVVALPEGGVRVYYTDAARSELPAATVSDVVVEIARPGSATEYVAMAVSASGDFWEGSSQPVADPQATVSVGFLYEGEPLMLDVPASALLPEPTTASVTTAEAGHVQAETHHGH